MHRPSPPWTFAIDAQISADVAGGTETALLALLTALGRLPTEERFVLLGLKKEGKTLLPFLGPNQSLEAWPWPHRWFDPADGRNRPMSERWMRLWKRAGPLQGLVEAAHRRYAHERPLGPRSRRLMERLGPLGALVPRASRLFHGLRSLSREPVAPGRADRRLRSRGVSAVHFPYPLHFPTRLPFVYEPWGLPHFHQPEAFRPGEAEWMDRLYRSGCEGAALVVTATRWVKEDIVSRYGIPRERVAVIPRLPRSPGGGVPEPAKGLPRALPREFALFPAMTWPSKNHLGLLRALARLRDVHGQVLHVVCTGRADPAHWPRIESELRSLGLGGQVHFLGTIPFEELQGLYARARFLVFPSLFEGLGLPILEAFQQGLPVVAARAACIPEVVGDAALLFDPASEESIAAALLRAMRSPELLLDLRERGRARLERHFPRPEKTAKMFLACYRRAASAPLSEEERALFEEMVAT